MKLKYRDTEIYYDSTGEGRALVMLHGFLESSTMWSKLRRDLANKYKIVTIDLPGFGMSGNLAPVHTMEMMAEVVMAVIEELDLKKLTILGHSMGGYVALALVERYPRVVDRLILLNSTPAPDSPERKLNRDRASELILKQRDTFIRMAVSNLFLESVREKFADEIEAMMAEALLFSTEGINAAIQGMKIREDRIVLLKNFRGEKIMISGKADEMIPVTVSEVLAKHCEVTFFSIEGGHMSLTENYNEIVKIMHFID